MTLLSIAGKKRKQTLDSETLSSFPMSKDPSQCDNTQGAARIDYGKEKKNSKTSRRTLTNSNIQLTVLFFFSENGGLL